MSNKGCGIIKTRLILILIFLLILPFNVFAVYEVTDSRCTTDIKLTLRDLASNVTYSISKIKDNDEVFYNMEILNIDSSIYVIDSIDNNIYNIDSTIENITPGTIVKLNIYASDETYCEGYKIDTISVQIPYYNKYSENELCDGYEDYALCIENANVTITEDQFISQMNSYIASLNSESGEATESAEESSSSSKFDLVNFIIEYNEYLSGLGLILLVIYITVVIERANKKRGIL